MGASAGGHVAACAMTGYGRQTYTPIDAVDLQSARPDFGILLYPVITMDEPFAHSGSKRQLLGSDPLEDAIRKYSPEQNVSADCPEVFLLHTDEDVSVKPENSILFYSALRCAGIPAELHIFRDGVHGMGIERSVGLPAGAWPDICVAWMTRVGLLTENCL
jgi:acetyl esterase/lipase